MSHVDGHERLAGARRAGEVAEKRVVEQVGEALGEVADESERIAEHVEAEYEHVGLIEHLDLVVVEYLVVHLAPRARLIVDIERLEAELDVLELGDGGAERLEYEVDDGVGGGRRHLGVVGVRRAVDAEAQIERNGRQVEVVEAHVRRLYDLAAAVGELHDFARQRQVRAHLLVKPLVPVHNEQDVKRRLATTGGGSSLQAQGAHALLERLLQLLLLFVLFAARLERGVVPVLEREEEALVHLEEVLLQYEVEVAIDLQHARLLLLGEQAQ